MKKPTSCVPFHGTKEQEQQLLEFIHAHKGMPGAAMPVLQEAQNIYGYLPLEVQSLIARELEIPVETLYGISTFYSQFSLSPKGKYNISVCMGTACYVKGSGAVLDTICKKLNLEPESTTPDGIFSLTACRCIGACGLAPVMMINDEVYGRLTPEMTEEILDRYLKEEGVSSENNG